MFNPEFRNRLSAIIEFAALTPPVIERVVDKFLRELSERLEKQKVTSKFRRRRDSGWPSAATIRALARVRWRV